MAKQGVIIDYSTLAALRDGKTLQPRWSTGAALLNLHAQLRA